MAEVPLKHQIKSNEHSKVSERSIRVFFYKLNHSSFKKSIHKTHQIISELKLEKMKKAPDSVTHFIAHVTFNTNSI